MGTAEETVTRVYPEHPETVGGWTNQTTESEWSVEGTTSGESGLYRQTSR